MDLGIMNFKAVHAIFAALLLAACAPDNVTQKDAYPDICPDYVGVTVPESLCGLQFRMTDGSVFKKSVEKKADTLFVSVTAWQKGSKTATAFRPFPVYVSKDAIDPYIAYRLIEPGYESWHYIGIYQRELASFKESPIVTNRQTNLGCMNCHSFPEGDPSKMLFHARGASGGTIIADKDGLTLTDLSQIGPKRQGTYPHWHPDGRHVAFSSNTTYQDFNIKNEQPLEVFDTESDLLILDTETMKVTEYPTAGAMETFPCWSEDGSTLYYCSAPHVDDIQNNKGKVHYSLMARDFKDGRLQDEERLIYGSDSLSVSFPRISSGTLVFTLSSFGTFPIWHKEADLWALDLASGEARALEELNSGESDSYHSWSSNGKWIVFSSRRVDGRYTRLYISHYNGDGSFTKPFQLPQDDPDFDGLRLKSYNIPEFVKGEVPDYRKQLKKLFRK